MTTALEAARQAIELHGKMRGTSMAYEVRESYRMNFRQHALNHYAAVAEALIASEEDRKRLWTALCDFGRHETACATFGPGLRDIADCDCGLGEALILKEPT